MTRAYDETYLSDAMNAMGDMLDYAVHDYGYDLTEYFAIFLKSDAARGIERENPKYVAGLSGPELCADVIFKAKGIRPDAEISENAGKSPEYWAGWILAYYQWYTAQGFASLSEQGLTIERVLALYNPLHEAPDSKFAEIAARIIGENSTTE